jgi:argininosuccinate synthase
MDHPITIRPATLSDVQAIVVLIAQNARRGGLLPRGEASIRAHIDNFLIAESAGATVGCGSLLPMNATLVELRSLAVDENARGGGIGKLIVAALIEEARKRNFGTLFALTRAVSFFEKCGFQVAPKEFFPEKVWNDCVACPLLENCDEVAVMRPLGRQAEAGEVELGPEDRERVLEAIQRGRLAKRAVSTENLIPLETVRKLAAEAKRAGKPSKPRARKNKTSIKKVVLAYNGGLDSSAALPWLRETYGCEVICYIANVGQRDDFDALKRAAQGGGASKVVIKDLRDEFANEYLFPLIQSGAIYENKYLLGSSISRPLIAKHQVDVAVAEGADAVAHGATGKGNDQVRFELAYAAMNPALRVIAPWREWSFDGREDLFDYAISRGMPVDESARGLYTQDENLWHSNYEGGQLEDLEWEPGEGIYEWTEAIDDTPNAPAYVEIEFISGMPKKLDGRQIGNVALIEALNALGSAHGIGRIEMIENRLIGMKNRTIDETPGGTILRAAHQGLEEITLDRDTAHYKQIVALRYADLIYNGQWFTPLRDALQAFVTVTQRDVTGSVRVKLNRGHATVVQRKAAYSLYREDLATFNNDEAYDHKDAEGFIKFFGLSNRIKAQVDRKRAARVLTPEARKTQTRE